MLLCPLKYSIIFKNQLLKDCLLIGIVFIFSTDSIKRFGLFDRVVLYFSDVGLVP